MEEKSLKKLLFPCSIVGNQRTTQKNEEMKIFKIRHKSKKKYLKMLKVVALKSKNRAVRRKGAEYC